MTGKADGQPAHNGLRLVLTWAMILTASPLGIIPWRTFAVQEPYWYPWIHATILLILLFVSLTHPLLKSLRRFALMIVIIFLTGYGGGWNWGLIPFIRSTEIWNAWMSAAPSALYEIALHILRLTPATLILAFLLVTGRRRQQFFLVRGNIRVVFG